MVEPTVDFGGTFMFDPEDPTASTLDIAIDVAGFSARGSLERADFGMDFLSPIALSQAAVSMGRSRPGGRSHKDGTSQPGGRSHKDGTSQPGGRSHKDGTSRP